MKGQAAINHLITQSSIEQYEETMAHNIAYVTRECGILVDDKFPLLVLFNLMEHVPELKKADFKVYFESLFKGLRNMLGG